MSELSERVDRIRAVLAERPDGIKIAKFPPGRTTPPGDLPPGLADVLAITDGPRAGEIVVISSANLAKDHFSLYGAEAIPDEDAASWTRFATRLYEPVLVHNETGEVWWFPDTGVQWVDSTAFEKLADNVEQFLTEYVLGPGYLRICVPDDGWARLLADLGWATGDPGRA